MAASGKVDITEDAKLLLRAIEETHGRFGLNLPIEVLRGARNARVVKQGFDKLESHGKGSHKSEEYWKAVGRSLVQSLLVDARSMGKGKGKGKSFGAAVYGVSNLGSRLLQPGSTETVLADLEADSLEAEAQRLRRAAKRGLKAAPKAAASMSSVVAEANAGADSQVVTPARAPRTTHQGNQEQSVSAPKRRKKSTAGGACQQQPGEGHDGEDEEGGVGLAPRSNPGPIPSPSPLPIELDKALMPFQRAGVAFAVRKQGRVLIGDDMGLGKTIQAIATCCAFREDWPVLIIVPNSVRLVWADELERWIPDLGAGAVNVIWSGQDLHGLKQNTVKFHVITYGILSRASPVREYMREHMEFKMVVVDESHYIKNRGALRTREIMRTVSTAKRVLLLSGTPALARPVELYTQIEAVSPGLFASYSAFTQRYCAPRSTPWGTDLTGASNLKELHEKLKPVMVRRLKVDVLQELPSKRRQRIQLPVAESKLGACLAIKENMDRLGEEDLPQMRKLLMELYVETARAKEEAVCEYVVDLLEGGCKFLVFAHHLSMLDALEQSMVRAKVGYIRIDGSVNSSERLNRCTSFQGNDSIRVALLGVNAAGVGITLTEASTVVFAELHWTPGVLVQAEDRAHRIGQKNSVNIHYLMAAGTIDDIIWPSVSHKVEVVSTMCDGQRSFFKAAISKSPRKKSKASASGDLCVEEEDEDEDVQCMDDILVKAKAAQKVDDGPDSTKAKASPKRNPFSVMAMLKGDRPAKASKAADLSSLPKRKFTTDASGAPGEVEEIESCSDTEMPADVGPPISVCVSRTTNRIHVVDAETEKPIGFNFKSLDWEGLRDGAKFPEGSILHQARVQQYLTAFVKEWGALRPTDHRNLSDQVLKLPLHKHLPKKGSTSGSTKRRASRPQKPQAQEEDNTQATLDPDIPVQCAWCHELMDKSSGSSYCSRSCEDKDRVRIEPAFARKLVYAAERGVCRICHLDAQQLYERVKVMSPPERHQELLRAGFAITKPLLEKPTEGLFWQADHIVPVSEGGGEADLMNLRTLCTICHAKETRSLHNRLKHARWAADCQDIRDVVKRPTWSSVLNVDDFAGPVDDTDQGTCSDVVILE